MPDLSITHENGTCAQCMRNNVDGDRNFCEKNIRAGTCGLDVPKPLYRINDTCDRT
jgi:hypothetical protein